MINESPIVSIIMPVFNVEKYLSKSIESVLKQDYRNFELIIINDGSTDHSLRVATAFQKDSRVKIHNISNQGLSHARNVGVKKAIGKYIYFIDSDDVIETKLLSTAIYFMESKNASMSIFNFKVIGEHDEKLNDLFLMPLSEGIYESSEIIPQYLKGNIQNYAWSYITKAEVFKDNQIMFPEGKNYEDLAIFPHILSKVNKIVIISEKLYNYRRRNGSITSNNYKARTNLKDYVDNLIDNEPWMNQMFNQKYKKELSIYFLNNFLHVYLLSSREYGLEYFPVINLVSNKIKQYFKEYLGSGLTLKRKIIALLIYFNKGKLLYRSLLRINNK